MILWHLGVTAAVVFLTLGRRRIDYRVVLAGSLLPDLIDKPIGRIFLEEEFQNSRIFGHTFLLAILLLLIVQIFLRGESARRWFVLPIAVVLHLALDGMWGQPVTLFWPLLGAEFPKIPVENYWLEVLLRPLEHPVEGVKELVGTTCLVYLGWAFELHRRGPRAVFLRTGALPSSRGGSH